VTLGWRRKIFDAAEKLIESGDVSRSFYDDQKAKRDSGKGAIRIGPLPGAPELPAVGNAALNIANAKSQLGLARRNLFYTNVLFTH